MSSLDSSINAISTVSINDLYRRHIRPGRSDTHYLRTAKMIASVSGLFMIIGAVFLTEADTRTLQDTATILTSLLGAGLLGIYVTGFFMTRGDARHIWFGIAGTLIFTGWTILGSRDLLPAFLSVPFDLYYTGFVGNIVMFFLIYVSSSFLGRSDRNLEGLTIWTLEKNTLKEAAHE